MNSILSGTSATELTQSGFFVSWIGKEPDTFCSRSLKENLIYELTKYFSSHLIELEELQSQSPRERAFYVYRRLKECGWLSEEVGENYHVYASFEDYAISIIETLINLEEDRDIEYSSMVYSIYSQFKNFDIENGHKILDAQYSMTKSLMTKLKNLNTNIKRYIKRLVEDGTVDGWDDPRLVSIAALRRRGFTPESIKKFVDLCGVSKANSSVDYAMLEYCIREDLKLKKARTMAVLNPVKLVIDNYPEDQIEMLEVQNNLENPELGSRQVPFGRELYIEREDFMEEPVRKYFRMFPGNEVRLMNAYFVTCTGCEKDENGNITVIHGTYDPESKGGNSPDGRKVKGTIHWVAAKTAVKAECRLYENLIDEEKGVYNEDGSMNLNPNSLTVLKECYLEPSLKDAKAYDSFQFVRNGFFCVDAKDSKEDALVFNRIVSLKSSFKLPAAK